MDIDRQMHKLMIAIDVSKDNQSVYDVLCKLADAIRLEHKNGNSELLNKVKIPVVYTPDDAKTITQEYWNNIELINQILN